MKRKRINLEKIRARKKAFGPYAVNIRNGVSFFHVWALNLEEADKLADQKEREIRARDIQIHPCPN